jgi:transcriptional regulator with XRE-family HTH domain
MASDLKNLIALNIRTIRTKSTLSQTQLAKKAGLTARYISRIENDPQNLTIETMQKIAGVLGVEIADLIGIPSNFPAPKNSGEALDQAVSLLQSYRSLIG